MAIDMDKLHEFLGRFVTDLGATAAAGNVVIGHQLGLYRALADAPATADELAARTNTSPRYVAEWLRGQAAGGYVNYDAAADSYSMTEEQAFALANPEGAVYAPGAFVLALGTLRAVPQITEAFRTGAGYGWHQQDEDVFIGCEQFFRPGYIANLVPSWLPALAGVTEKLQAGAKVADIGCGLGASTILLAQEYPNSTFTGSDYHGHSIELARKRAGDAGVADRVSFEVASASTAGDDIASNLNPVGRVYYSFSSMLCVPNALSQHGGYSLGAQAGEAAIRQVATDAGFTRFRRAAETPFNIVYEVRP